MRPMFYSILPWILMALVGIGPVQAEDMRTSHAEARLKKAELLESAAAHREAARKEAAASRARILQDRSSLTTAIEEIRRKNRRIETDNQRLTQEIAALENQKADLQKKTVAVEGEVRETIGLIRSTAKESLSLVRLSPQSALIPGRGDDLEPIVEHTAYPGIDHVQGIVDLMFDEIQKSGEVRRQNGPFINRNGEETSAELLILGNFTAAYRWRGETGFLLYSDKSRRLFALSKLPSKQLSRKLDAYLSGASDDVPMDIAKGAALRQLTHRLRLWEQIPKGGPIVWPILGIGILALLIVLERCHFLVRKSVNADRFMGTVCSHIDREEWGECLDFCSAREKKPIPRVMMTGITCREMNRQDLENALQEAILNEIPRLERFMSTLGMLAAIAPLLGLLGTVTGMINTFHAITFFGTGNPRLMSGGISEALVTTMLGLSVAIPIMLAHTLLSRRVENMIATMEEKAVSLMNQLFKTRRTP